MGWQWEPKQYELIDHRSFSEHLTGVALHITRSLISQSLLQTHAGYHDEPLMVCEFVPDYCI